MNARETKIQERTQPTIAGEVRVMPCFSLSLSSEDLEGEIWRDCIGYDGYYSISNYGRIKSERREKRNGGYVKESILKQTVGANGEPTVKFSVDGLKKTQRPVELVGLAFLPDKKENDVYCHKNKIKTDNRLSNIFIATKARSCELDFAMGVKQDWGIGEMLTKQRNELLKTTDIYENGILSRKICTCCNRELDISSFYFRQDQNNYRYECKECILKHDGVVEIGKKTNAIENGKAGLRKCTKCKEIKSLDTDFSVSKHGYLGRQHSCKACQKIANDRYRFRFLNKA